MTTTSSGRFLNRSLGRTCTFLEGMETMITFLFFVASATVAASAPISPASCFKDTGPRELAIETVCPSLTNFEARHVPISPEPMIPIFITHYFNNVDLVAQASAILRQALPAAA